MTDLGITQLVRRNKPQQSPPQAPIPQDVEQEIREAMSSQGLTKNTSAHMIHVQELVDNAVTQAHGDTCRALDKVVTEAKALLERIEKKVEVHKKKLQDEGQKIALELEASMQILTDTVEWVEKQSPQLRQPSLRKKADGQKQQEE